MEGHELPTHLVRPILMLEGNEAIVLDAMSEGFQTICQPYHCQDQKKNENL